MTRLSKLIVQLSALSLESASLFNACTLVPTVFRWHGKMEFTFHFHFSFFVFAWHWKTDMNFVFRFHITLKNAFELRFSFLFSHPWLWKRDMNFFFRFHITLENGFEFRFCMACYLKNRSEFRLSFEVPAHPLAVDRGIHFLCKGKQLNLAPGPKWVVNSPAPMICPPHTVLLF